MYIKLGFEWELFEEKEHVWIGNSLTNKLFKIEQKEKKEIIKEISNGTTEQELIVVDLINYQNTDLLACL